MLTAIGFWLFLLCAYAIVWMNGDREARIFINFTLLAATLTALAMATTAGNLHALMVFATDGALLIVALIFVGRSRFYWPIWFAGFQSITVASELARQLFPNNVPSLYGAMASFWAIPAVGCMTIAIVKDNRARLSIARVEKNDGDPTRVR
ncbi:MAG: hypothetical protein ACTHM8_14715 [Sphingomonas sp.]